MSSRARLEALIEAKIGQVMMSSQLARLDKFIELRTAETQATSATSYIDNLVNGANAEEMQRLVNLCTIGKTLFMRHPDHVEFVVKAIVPELDKVLPASQAINLWSAACSTGEEPFTLAMALAAEGWFLKKRDIRILATDINTDCIDFAQAGRVSDRRVDGLPQTLRCYVHRTAHGTSVVPEILQRVRFKTHNLVGPQPYPVAEGGWNVVVCANVLFYFRPDVASLVLRRFGSVMAPRSVVLGGGAENLGYYENDFLLLQYKSAFALANRAQPQWVTPWLHQATPAPGTLDGGLRVVQPTPASTPEPCTPAARRQAVPPYAVPLRAEPERELRHLLQGERRLAVPKLVKLKQQCPEDARLGKYLAILYMRLRQFEDACDELEDALSLMPFASETHYFLGFAHAKCGRSEEALRAYRRAIFLDPNFTLARYAFAVELHRQGDYPRCLEEYRRVAKGISQGAALRVRFGDEILAEDFSISGSDLLFLVQTNIALAEQKTKLVGS